jgi:hypothetical protein
MNSETVNPQNPFTGKDVEALLEEAVNRAIWTHKQLGYPIVIWKDGKVVTIPPEEIKIEYPIEKES